MSTSIKIETEPIAVESDEIAELDRRWKKSEGGERTVSQERVVRWLRTWGTPEFKPWPVCSLARTRTKNENRGNGRTI